MKAEMDKGKIAANLSDLVVVGDEPKCLSCHCYLDVLRQVREDLAVRSLENLPETAALDEVLARSVQAQTHDCLGCDPCLPVVPFNVLNELFREPVESRGCSCAGDFSGKTVPEPVAPPEGTSSWPPLPGSYRVLDPRAEGSICTLASEDLYEALADEAPPGVAIVGSMVTENLGIERLVRNVVANPAVSWLLLCGIDSKGHKAGESLLALSRNGVDAEMRIVGAPGQRARLANLTPAEVERFRRRVTVFSHLGVTNSDEVLDLAAAVPRRSSDDADGDSTTAVPQQVVERVSDLPSSPRDPYGYFVIDLLSDRKMLRLEHYTNDHLLTNVLTGENARDLYLASIRKELLSRLDHAAYLGYQLGRAEDAMRRGGRFTQDG
jgi:tetrahydromethanopterin S-methyltransferase subunit A